jgi:NAD(P)-dependent dehydrogenase (short-subunit alcohol dehydrogenase family)
MTGENAPTGHGFASKTVLITGGNSGIGRVVATSLAGRGAHVILSGRDPGRGAETVAAIREAGGKADFEPADLAVTASVRGLAKRAVELGDGHVDILVNNAGVYPFSPTPLVSEDAFEKVFAINVRAPFYLVAELATAARLTSRFCAFIGRDYPDRWQWPDAGYHDFRRVLAVQRGFPCSWGPAGGTSQNPSCRALGANSPSTETRLKAGQPTRPGRRGRPPYNLTSVRVERSPEGAAN